MRLEDVTPGAQITGIAGDAPVTVVAAPWIGSNALRLTYRTENGRLDERLLYRDHEPQLTLVKRPPPTTSPRTRRCSSWPRRRCGSGWRPGSTRCWRCTPRDLEPLPHQIEAVYGELLDRTPLRFLLADDPGAGQDDHGRAVHQGADAPRGPGALPDRGPGRPGRAVAGRAARTSSACGSSCSPASSPTPTIDGSVFTRYPAADRADGPAVPLRRPARAAGPLPTGTWWWSTRRTGCRRTTSARS